MNELHMQKYVVDSVNHAGGFAIKMSHRFLVGIPDLLVKLPDDPLKVFGESLLFKDKYKTRPAAILEVKQRDAPKSDIEFTLEVTPQQKRYLKMARDGGMPAGVISFLQVRGKGKAGLRMAVYTLTEIERLEYRAHTADHMSVPTEEEVVRQLIAWHREYEK